MQNNVWPPYWSIKDKTPRINIVRTSKSFIYDENKTKIFDGIASWWSVCHGYNHPKIISNMKKCLSAMPHVMFAGITHNYAETLAQELYNFSFGQFKKTFFCDSGSVAIEVSIKMALQYWQSLHKYEKTHVLTFSGCYHGETFMASSLSSDENSYISSYTNNVLNVKLPCNAEEMYEFKLFLEKNHKRIACSIIEPLVQGAAGIKMYSSAILRDIFNLIKKYDILFICDECAMGFYRTGRRFAFDHAEIAPDIITLGKALSGGHISLAAACTTEHIFSTICTDGYFKHGPTFMANPLACSAGIASLNIFNDFNYPAHICKITDIFTNVKDRLQKSLHLEARVLGAIIAIEINAKNLDIKAYIYENTKELKLWVRPISNTLYLMPPLNVEIDDLLDAVKSFEIIVKNTHTVV